MAVALNARIGTVRARAYQASALARWPRLANWGIYNCRHIHGSTTWSQHAWGNAVDLAPPNKAYGDQVAAWARANAGALGIAHLLWQVPDHFDHIHADFLPTYTGTPPCAGGADVPINPTRGSGGIGSQGTNIPKGKFPRVPVVSDVVDAAKGIGGFVGWITDGHNWVRLGEVLGGGVVIIIGAAGAAKVFGHPQLGEQVAQTLPIGRVARVFAPSRVRERRIAHDVRTGSREAPQPSRVTVSSGNGHAPRGMIRAKGGVIRPKTRSERLAT